MAILVENTAGEMYVGRTPCKDGYGCLRGLRTRWCAYHRYAQTKRFEKRAAILIQSVCRVKLAKERVEEIKILNPSRGSSLYKTPLDTISDNEDESELTAQDGKPWRHDAEGKDSVEAKLGTAAGDGDGGKTRNGDGREGSSMSSGEVSALEDAARKVVVKEMEKRAKSEPSR